MIEIIALLVTVAGVYIAYLQLRHHQSSSLQDTSPSQNEKGTVERAADEQDAPASLQIFLNAAAAGDIDTVRRYVNEGGDLDAFEPNHRTTALHLAAHKNQVLVVKLLTSNGADPDIPNSHGYSPLTEACYWGHCDVVKTLISAGADVDFYDVTGSYIKKPLGMTPLTTAAERGHLEIVSLLLEAGADVTKTGPYGRTALSFARKSMNEDLARLLAPELDDPLESDVGYQLKDDNWLNSRSS